MKPDRDGLRTLKAIFEEYMDLPEFLGIKVDSVNQKGNTGDYPIHVAVHRGDIDEVDCLIGNGTDVNARGDLGYTPLHIAVSNDLVEIVKSLIKAGAKLDIRNDDGMEPLQLAKNSMMRALLRKDSRPE